MSDSDCPFVLSTNVSDLDYCCANILSLHTILRTWLKMETPEKTGLCRNCVQCFRLYDCGHRVLYIQVNCGQKDCFGKAEEVHDPVESLCESCNIETAEASKHLLVEMGKLSVNWSRWWPLQSDSINQVVYTWNQSTCSHSKLNRCIEYTPLSGHPTDRSNWVGRYAISHRFEDRLGPVSGQQNCREL